MRTCKRIQSLILAVALIAAMLRTSAAAFEADNIAPAEALSVYVRSSGVDTLLHTYSEAEMWALSDDSEVPYSGIDNMPATVRSEARGVYLTDFLRDAQKYTSYDVWSCDYLRVKCTDNALDRYTIGDLIDTPRYYYADIHGESGGMNEDASIKCPLGTGLPVGTMLAITGRQQRLPVPGGEGRDTELSKYTLLFGMTPEEGENAVRRVSSYKRGIDTFIIDMGGASGGEPTAITSVTLDKTAVTLAERKSYQLTAIVEPSNAKDAAVTWKSSDSSVAAVSATGVITGMKAGSAVITATSVVDDSMSAKCTVTVVETEIAPTSISLSKSKLTLLPDSEGQLKATVYPGDATYTGVVWTSSDSAVATVDADGKIRAAAIGAAVITATVEGTGLYDTCTVTVTDEITAPAGIGLSRTILRLKPGEAYQMKLTVEPDNASSYTALWGSSAPSIVSVDTEGRLTARNTGVAVVSVMIDENGLTASCTVTVSDDAIGFSDSAGHWAKNDIVAMAEHGFISGYDGGTFRPEARITRAEFVTILIRVLQDVQGVAVTGENTFSDTNGHWAQTGISTAVKLGVLGGYGDGRFGPDDFVTREQIAIMLINAAGVSGGEDTGFADDADISQWAREQVSAVAELGWIRGHADGTFRPQINATRAEVCVILLRFYEDIAKAGGAS